MAGRVADLDRLIAVQGEPFGSTSIYAQYRVFALAAEAGVKVMLDGQGADEERDDGNQELRDIARFLANVSPDIPWHVTAFHSDYKMTDRDGTPARTLVRAAEIGLAEGLRYVYAGNLPGRVGPFENTYCPSCRMLLVERVSYTIHRDYLTPTRGLCPTCSTRIPGVWGRRERA